MKLRHNSQANAFSAHGRLENLPLTKRENEVMRWLAEGMPDKLIAEKLHISFWTVRKHLHNSFSKLHVGNRTQAAIAWPRN
jgi:DNA-binding NarL/FixJ family response regulator